VTIDGVPRQVVVHVRPASGGADEEGYALIVFDEVDPVSPATVVSVEEGHRTREVEGELTLTRQRLQSLTEEYESSREEMRSTNEELQSTNEELRSTMEELETSKEELQSINEELVTLNQENRHKVEELSQMSSDLQNLIVATDIPTLFLDRALRILRFTPRLGDLFNIRATDRGRPLSDLTHRLKDCDLIVTASQVLAELKPVEQEVRDDQADGSSCKCARIGHRRIGSAASSSRCLTSRRRSVPPARSPTRRNTRNESSTRSTSRS